MDLLWCFYSVMPDVLVSYWYRGRAAVQKSKNPKREVQLWQTD